VLGVFRPGRIARRLGAVAAVLGAAAGLDGEQQGGELHRVGVVMGTVDLLRPVEQVIERQIEQRPHLGNGPSWPLAAFRNGSIRTFRDGVDGRLLDLHRAH